MSEHEAKLNRIHAILNEYDGEEALRRIRELLYGPVPETLGEQP